MPLSPSAPYPRQPCQHPTTQFFTDWMPILPPNQQHQIVQSLKKWLYHLKSDCTISTVSCLSYNCYVLYQNYHSSSTENVSGDWFRELREVNLKQETYDVCFVIYQSYTNTHTTVLQLSGFCPGHRGWAGTRRNIHPLTPIVVINRPLSAHPSTLIHDILPVRHMHLIIFFHNLCPSFLWSTSWPGTLHFMLHTFRHPIIVFFSQHMPIPSQPVSLWYWDYVI